MTVITNLIFFLQQSEKQLLELRKNYNEAITQCKEVEIHIQLGTISAKECHFLNQHKSSFDRLATKYLEAILTIEELIEKYNEEIYLD